MTLLTSRRLAPLLVTQTLGAINDNLFKNALVVLVLFKAAAGGGPARLFGAVAQVLAYVYQLRAALSGARTAMPGALPELNVPAELDPHNKPVAGLEDFEE